MCAQAPWYCRSLRLESHVRPPWVCNSSAISDADVVKSCIEGLRVVTLERVLARIHGAVGLQCINRGRSQYSLQLLEKHVVLH